MADRLDGEFCRAVQLVFGCQGSVIICGIGKAGLVGRKIMATLASTGTPSHCLHRIPKEIEAGEAQVGRGKSDE